VETPHRHKQEGILYNVSIDITVPGAELVIKREPDEDLTVAIRNSFETAYRRLEEYSSRQRGDVKHHEDASHAIVTKIFDGFGFLATPDEREIYFHKNSVVKGSFSKLKVGTQVRFVEEQGEKGPQASTVSLA
jgi:cold shock CspA family protein